MGNRDIRRLKLTLELPESGGMDEPRGARSALTDRVKNSPRLEDVGSQVRLYLGFCITGFIYGGLHCLAWNAPFATQLE
jgi:hypothetical protein